jgi:hypothetical protein
MCGAAVSGKQLAPSPAPAQWGAASQLHMSVIPIPPQNKEKILTSSIVKGLFNYFVPYDSLTSS